MVSDAAAAASNTAAGGAVATAGATCSAPTVTYSGATAPSVCSSSPNVTLIYSMGSPVGLDAGQVGV